MQIGGAVLVIWLLIGLLAAGQRGYFTSSDNGCTKAGSTFVTIIAGPLNYVGINPKVTCTPPSPSK